MRCASCDAALEVGSKSASAVPPVRGCDLSSPGPSRRRGPTMTGTQDRGRGAAQTRRGAMLDLSCSGRPSPRGLFGSATAVHRGAETSTSGGAERRTMAKSVPALHRLVIWSFNPGHVALTPLGPAGIASLAAGNRRVVFHIALSSRRSATTKLATRVEAPLDGRAARLTPSTTNIAGAMVERDSSPVRRSGPEICERLLQVRMGTYR